MAADTHGGGPQDEIIRISPETRERLRGWADDGQRDEEVLQELLDQVELGSDSTTWPTGDYY